MAVAYNTVLMVNCPFQCSLFTSDLKLQLKAQVIPCLSYAAIGLQMGLII